MKNPRLPLPVAFLSLFLLFCLTLTSFVVVAGPKDDKNPDEIDYFELSIEELLSIKVNASASTESRQNYVPSSITIINRTQIENSGGRTLNDILNMYVPGYFKAEDKDDTIAGFRGLAPDNNSKLLLLVDGMRTNADWFWGPADSILNGVGLQFIERIEVIRGPGSVTLGQGAQLGVINVITRTVEAGSRVTVAAGEGQMRSVSGMAGMSQDGLLYQFIGTREQLDGFALPEEGWAIEVAEGDSSHPNPPALRGNRLNRNSALRLLAKVSDFDWSLQFQHHQQKRDLYNWTKDRDQVEQRLTIIAGDYQFPIDNNVTANFNGNWQLDDYALYDHTTGVTTGGAREQRVFLQAKLFSTQSTEGYSWQLAAEVEHFKSGDKNWQGDNFIVNQTGQLNESVNETNTWLFDDYYLNKAVIVEANYATADYWKTNIGLRYDDNAQWGAELTPRASITYHQGEEKNVYRLTYQKGFKGAPGIHYTGGFLGDGLLSEDNLGKLEGSGMTTSSNGPPVQNAPSPMPESLTSYEFAILGQIDNYWRYEVTAFYNEIENIIVTKSTRNGTPGAAIGTDRIGNWGGVFYFANEPGTINIRGIELSSIWKVENWQHQLSYSTHEIVSADGFDYGLKSPIAGGPDDLNSNGMPEGIWRYQGFWNVNEDWKLSYQHVLLESWWAPWTNSREPGLAWGNAVANWQYNQNLNLKLIINNLWNERALYPIRERGRGNDEPGTPSLEPRNVSFSITYRF